MLGPAINSGKRTPKKTSLCVVPLYSTSRNDSLEGDRATDGFPGKTTERVFTITMPGEREIQAVQARSKASIHALGQGTRAPGDPLRGSGRMWLSLTVVWHRVCTATRPGASAPWACGERLESVRNTGRNRRNGWRCVGESGVLTTIRKTGADVAGWDTNGPRSVHPSFPNTSDDLAVWLPAQELLGNRPESSYGMASWFSAAVSRKVTLASICSFKEENNAGVGLPEVRPRVV